MYFNKWLRLTIGFILLLMVVRIAYSNRLHYIFLPWNLLLAYIPLWISSKQLQPAVTKFSLQSPQKFISFVWFGLWLLFLPNAPYIITDLVHLTQRPPVPYYFDMVLVFLYALSGLVYFFLSVHQAEKWWISYWGSRYIYGFYFMAFGLCSFGIYLGRFGRFNSWNIITKPQSLFTEILERILFPFSYPSAWAVTILFSTMLFLLYQLGKNFRIENTR